MFRLATVSNDHTSSLQRRRPGPELIDTCPRWSHDSPMYFYLWTWMMCHPVLPPPASVLTSHFLEPWRQRFDSIWSERPFRFPDKFDPLIISWVDKTALLGSALCYHPPPTPSHTHPLSSSFLYYTLWVNYIWCILPYDEGRMTN